VDRVGEGEKARIVAESFEEGANISEVARRHGVVRGLLTVCGGRCRGERLPADLSGRLSDRREAFVPSHQGAASVTACKQSTECSPPPFRALSEKPADRSQCRNWDMRHGHAHRSTPVAELGDGDTMCLVGTRAHHWFLPGSRSNGRIWPRAHQDHNAA
jgi:hypothetical protein